MICKKLTPDTNAILLEKIMPVNISFLRNLKVYYQFDSFGIFLFFVFSFVLFFVCLVVAIFPNICCYNIKWMQILVACFATVTPTRPKQEIFTYFYKLYTFLYTFWLKLSYLHSEKPAESGKFILGKMLYRLVLLEISVESMRMLSSCQVTVFS